jgi:hypothetical protein
VDNALAELRHRAAREGHCFQHVQTITVASTSTLRRRWAAGTTFSTSPAASGKRTRPGVHR